MTHDAHAYYRVETSADEIFIAGKSGRWVLACWFEHQCDKNIATEYGWRCLLSEIWVFVALNL